MARPTLPRTGFHRAIVIALAAVLLFFGCEGPTAVDAVPRTSQFKPVFGVEKAAEVSIKPSRNSIDASFLHEDHFACVRINPTAIMANADFKDIQWEDLQGQIAKWVGEENSRFEKIKSIWLILDQSTFSTLGLGNDDGGSPFVAVLDYFQPYNEQEVEQCNLANANDGKSVQSVSDTRLAVGQADALSKLKNGTSTSALASLVAQWDENSAAQGAVAIAPIRSLLVSVFDMVSQFGPEAKKFRNLPDVVQHIQFKIHLEDSNDGEPILLEGHVAIDDDDLASEIVKSISRLGNGGSAIPMAGMMGGRNGALNVSEMMFSPASASAMKKLGDEIKENNLFSIRKKTGEISFQLLRPDSFRDTIAAAVADGKKQLEIIERAKSLDKIAKAFKAYEEKYDCLPSMTAISNDESETMGLPPQFSWRVAILPLLDQQELYNRFDFDKSWDATENLDVAREMPEVFGASPGDMESAFHLVAGDGCTYRLDRTRPKLGDIADAKIWTALVIQVDPKLAQNWIRPGFVDLANASTEDLGYEDENGILFVNAAFDTRVLKKDNELIRKVLTSEGEEKMTRRDFIRMNIPGQN